MPEKRAQWGASLEKSRSTYRSLKEEFKICPTHYDEAVEDLLSSLPPEDSGGGARGGQSSELHDDSAAGERVQVADDPLQIDRDKSQWARYVSHSLVETLSYYMWSMF